MDIWNLETAPKEVKMAPHINQNRPLEKVAVPSVQPEALMPYIKNESELIIPGNCPEKYKWWKDGQSVFETLLELDAPDTLFEKYVTEGNPRSWGRWQKIIKERIGNK